MRWPDLSFPRVFNGHRLPLMIIREFDIKSIAIHKPETDAPLIVDRDGKPAYSIPLQCVKAVAWRYLYIFKPGCQIDILQLPQRPSHDFRWESLRSSRRIQFLSVSVSKCLDHKWIVICHVTIVNDSRESSRTQYPPPHLRTFWPAERDGAAQRYKQSTRCGPRARAKITSHFAAGLDRPKP